MVYRMLQHLYMQTYTVNLYHDPFWCSNDSWAMTRLHVHAQMYSLGDKYDISSLKKEATQRFTKDVHIPGDKKSETLTLLSVVDLIYTSVRLLQHILSLFKQIGSTETMSRCSRAPPEREKTDLEKYNRPRTPIAAYAISSSGRYTSGTPPRPNTSSTTSTPRSKCASLHGIALSYTASAPLSTMPISPIWRRVYIGSGSATYDRFWWR